MHVGVCVCVCMCVYIYANTQRTSRMKNIYMRCLRNFMPYHILNLALQRLLSTS